jgi:hypothetical protein
MYKHVSTLKLQGGFEISMLMQDHKVELFM